jgi:hypothetical protein
LEPESDIASACALPLKKSNWLSAIYSPISNLLPSMKRLYVHYLLKTRFLSLILFELGSTSVRSWRYLWFTPESVIVDRNTTTCSATLKSSTNIYSIIWKFLEVDVKSKTSTLKN